MDENGKNIGKEGKDKRIRADFMEYIREQFEWDELKRKNPFIALINAVKDFDFDDYILRAADHIDLNIDEGEFITIKGPSGAGKTTLLHLIAGLEKPSEGKVILNHIDITPMQEETLITFRAFNVGIIFQNYNLISSFTALENIMFPLEISGVSAEESEKRALELLRKVELIERKDHLPHQLSAGEQQRIAIARALANDPPIIIADEPTANLDTKNAALILNLFNELKESGKTLIVATHDPNIINASDKIVIMDDGRIVEVVPSKRRAVSPEGGS